MACPSDITVTFKHKCSSEYGKCSTDSETTMTLSQLLSIYQNSLDGLYPDSYGDSDKLNEVIQKEMGLI